MSTIDFLSSPKRFTHQAIADGLGIRREAVGAWKRRGYVPRRWHAKLAQLAGDPGLAEELAKDEAAATAARMAK